MSSTVDYATAAQVIGGMLAGFFGSKIGGAKGASQELNGTALSVKRTEASVSDIGGKLDGHIVKTAENFREISDRTSNIEGRLETPFLAHVKAPQKEPGKPRAKKVGMRSPRR